MGLREQKKLATRQKLMRAALELFEERGFDNVSVAEVAQAAEVSKMTVFNYFPVKEDLITGVGKHHIEEPATVVRERAPGQTPLRAMLDYFLDGLAQRQPFTGLNDRPAVLRLHRLISSTPALTLRWLHYHHESERLLAETLVEESSSQLTARLIAAQILGTQQVLVQENQRRILAGEAADDVYPDAVRAAEHGYRMLEKGLGGIFRKLDLRQQAMQAVPSDRPSVQEGC